MKIVFDKTKLSVLIDLANVSPISYVEVNTADFLLMEEEARERKLISNESDGWFSISEPRITIYNNESIGEEITISNA